MCVGWGLWGVGRVWEEILEVSDKRAGSEPDSPGPSLLPVLGPWLGWDLKRVHIAGLSALSPAHCLQVSGATTPRTQSVVRTELHKAVLDPSVTWR
jgi:hypothetical protein